MQQALTNIKKNHFTNLLYMLSGALIMLAPALYNGFPLVYSDTGTYIMSGMEKLVPVDRPVIYGLFIRIVSMKVSLWMVVFTQCMMMSYLLFVCFTVITANAGRKMVFIAILIFLTAFTSVGWYAGQIMPDIFTPACILSIFLLLFNKQLNRPDTILISCILVLSIGMHLSNFIISILILLAAFVFCRMVAFEKTHRKRFILPFALTVTGILMISVVNYAMESSFKISKGSHVFLMGKLLDSGVLKKFLDDKCPDNHYALCGCKDSLPKNSRDFLWAGNSPLYKDGGWEKSAYEYNRVIAGVFTSPKHCFMFACNALFSSASQLFQNDIGSDLVSTWYADPSSPPYAQIEKHFPNELKPYRISRQNSNLWGQGLNFDFINRINYLLLIFCVLFLVFIFSCRVVWNKIDAEFKIMLLICILGIVLNAVVTASLANVYDRLQARVSWMFVLIMLYAVAVNYKVLFSFMVEKVRGFSSR